LNTGTPRVPILKVGETSRSMNYAKGIKRARERAKLSKRGLAHSAGFDASYIAHIETGKKKPSLDALEAIAKALDLPVNVLLLMCAEREDLRGTTPVKAKALLEKLVAILDEK
jgi:transcriptional regulator with XRE-family HTH domain